MNTDADEITAPLPAGDRVVVIDVLRGVAVLGILLMNVRVFAGEKFNDPTTPGGFDWLNFAVWGLGNALFDGKMIGIFSLLFGAGLIMMSERLEARGKPAGSIIIRRMAWLFVFGVGHVLLLWSQDILSTYAVCGLVFYPLRRRSPKTLVLLGSALLVISAILHQWPGLFYNRWIYEPFFGWWYDEVPPCSPQVAYHSGYGTMFNYRVWDAVFWQGIHRVQFLFWRTGGFIALGMGLMKLGVLAGRRPAPERRLLRFGYGLGLPLAVYSLWEFTAHSSALSAAVGIPGLSPFGRLAGSLAAPLVALGHVALILRWQRAAPDSLLMPPLAATGRMALTNYLMQSIICVPLFSGWGLDQWGRWTMAEQLLLVLVVWTVQLGVSTVWLERFRFGPMEWLWRSLTYGRSALRPSLQSPP